MSTLELSAGNTPNYELVEAKRDGATFVFFNALNSDKEMWTAAISQSLQTNGQGMLLYNLRGQAGSATTQKLIETKSIIMGARPFLITSNRHLPYMSGCRSADCFHCARIWPVDIAAQTGSY